MALERIVATVLAQPSQRYRAHDSRPPAVGQIIAVEVKEAAGDDLLVNIAEGMVLRLKGLGHLASNLRHGDTVTMRVLSTEPHLTLALVDTPASARRAAQPATMETPAMQLDQLALQRMMRPAADAIALGNTWRAQVLTTLQQQSALLRAPQAEQGMQLTVAQPWVFPAFAWGGIPVLLRLVEADDSTHSPKRRRRNAALWIEFDLPGFGRVAVQVQIAPDGIFLLLAVEQERAVQPVRNALPAIARALAAAELHLRRCHLSRGLPGADTMHAWTGHDQRMLAAQLPPALFRAASEVMVAMVAAGFNPASR